MQAPSRHMVPAVKFLQAPPGAPDHTSDLNQVVGDPAKSESHILWSKRSAESPVHGGSSSSVSNSLGPVYTGTAWVLHMGPWLASMGPAHGPLAWVLHKGPGRGSCTRTPGEVLHKGSWLGSSSMAFREGLGPSLYNGIDFIRSWHWP